jgi:hypothetical protein
MKIVLRPSIFVRGIDAISQLLNVFLFNGNANDSVSGRAFKESWKLEKVINFIFFWEPEHCKLAYYTDLARAKTMIYEEENK